MSHDQLLMSPTRGDLGLVGDLVDAAVLRLKTALVKRCGGDVPVHTEVPQVRQLRELLQPTEVAVGAAAPFTLSAGNLRGLVILDEPLIQRLVGLFLGESPLADVSAVPRRLTRLDLQMAHWVCGDIVDAVVAACTVTRRLSAQLGEIQTNPRSVTALPQSPAVVQVTLRFGPEGEAFGSATLVLPAQASGVLWPERRRPIAPPARKRPRSMERVEQLKVPVVAEVLRRTMTLSEVRGMRTGDVIPLGNLRDVAVRVGGKPVIQAEAGEQEGVRCVRVRRRLGPQEGPPTGR